MANPLKTIWKGLKATGKGIARVDDVLDNIPFAGTVIAMIPVAGPILNAALSRIDIAQELIPGADNGPERRAKAEELLRADLAAMGFTPEFVHEVVALAFLMRQGKAGIRVEVETPKQ